MIEDRVTFAPAADGSDWATSAADLAMSAAREDLAAISAQINDGHARLVKVHRWATPVRVATASTSTWTPVGTAG